MSTVQFHTQLTNQLLFMVRILKHNSVVLQIILTLFRFITVEKKVPVTVIKKTHYPVHVPGLILHQIQYKFLVLLVDETKIPSLQCILLWNKNVINLIYYHLFSVERPYPVHVDHPVPCKLKTHSISTSVVPNFLKLFQ